MNNTTEQELINKLKKGGLVILEREKTNPIIAIIKCKKHKHKLIKKQKWEKA